MRAHTQDVHFDVRCAIQLSTVFYLFAFCVCAEWTLNLVIGMSSTRWCSNFRRIVNKTQMGTVRWFFMRNFSVMVAEKTMDNDAESKKTHKNSSHTDEVEYNRSTTAKSAQFRARQQLCHCIRSLRQDTCIAICEQIWFLFHCSIDRPNRWVFNLNRIIRRNIWQKNSYSSLIKWSPVKKIFSAVSFLH